MILDSSSNPKTGNMSNILQNISSEKRNIFDQKVKESDKKDKLNSLVQLRQTRMADTYSIILILIRKIMESTSYMVMKFGL